MVASNAVIGIAYLAIALALLKFLDVHRGNVKLVWAFVLFASFIFLCGMTHFIDILVVWYPAYWLQAWVCAACAFVSAVTAVIIWPVAMKSTSRVGLQSVIMSLEEENKALKEELDRLKKPGAT